MLLLLIACIAAPAWADEYTFVMTTQFSAEAAGVVPDANPSLVKSASTSTVSIPAASGAYHRVTACDYAKQRGGTESVGPCFI